MKFYLHPTTSVYIFVGMCIINRSLLLPLIEFVRHCPGGEDCSVRF